jgi:hypothetical protein
VAYYLAVVNVPAMIVVHAMIFMYVLRHRAKFSQPQSPVSVRG